MEHKFDTVIAVLFSAVTENLSIVLKEGEYTKVLRSVDKEDLLKVTQAHFKLNQVWQEVRQDKASLLEFRVALQNWFALQMSMIQKYRRKN